MSYFTWLDFQLQNVNVFLISSMKGRVGSIEGTIAKLLNHLVEVNTAIETAELEDDEGELQ